MLANRENGERRVGMIIMTRSSSILIQVVTSRKIKSIHPSKKRIRSKFLMPRLAEEI